MQTEVNLKSVGEFNSFFSFAHLLLCLTFQPCLFCVHLFTVISGYFVTVVNLVGP